MKVGVKLFICFALALLSLASCTSYKKTAYFQDLVSNTSADKDSIVTAGQENLVKIQPFDVLDIKIGSSKQGFDKLFSSNVGGVLGTQAAGIGSSTGGAGANTGYYGGYFVDAAGNVNLPILGQVKLLNLSVVQAKEVLLEKAKEYLIEPYIDIKFLTFKVNVMGAVGKPGQITIANEKANLVEALAQAGDLTDFADARNVKLIRGDLKNPTVFQFNLTDSKTLAHDGFHLKPNDLIIVYPQRRKFFAANFATFLPIILVLNTVLSVITFIRVTSK